MVSEPATGPTDLRPGRWLDRYELVYPIACGGMAEVWLAKLRGPHGFEKLVALKTILPGLAEDLRFRRMFVDEAKIASGIEHVNVAHIWDLGEHAGLLYLAMEWVDGDSLQKLERAAQRAAEVLPTSVLIRIMADVCAGLHAAHELSDIQGKSLNVVHRDVSPQNILINAAGVAKLIDFGVAKARRRRSDDTATGTIKGKLQYMAPEQALGRPLDRRADIWAVGATLYRLLARRPLFSSVGAQSIIKRLSSPEPPAPLPSSVPSALSSVVLKALAFEPAGRYATAAELGAALEELLCGPNQATSQDVATCVARYLGRALAARREALGQALAACAAPEKTQPNRLASTASAAFASGPMREEKTRPLGGVALPSPRPDGHHLRAPAALGLLAFGSCVAWLLASSSGGPAPGPLPPRLAARTAAPLAVVAAVSTNPSLGLPALPTQRPALEAPERPLAVLQREPAPERKAKRGARVPLARKHAAPRVAGTPPPAITVATAREVIDDGF